MNDYPIPDDYRIYNRPQADGSFRPLSGYFEATMNDYSPDYDDEEAEALARDHDDAQAWLAQVEQEHAPDCPFCGHPVDVVEGVYICGNCIVSWDDIDKLERERDTLAAQGWAR